MGCTTSVDDQYYVDTATSADGDGDVDLSASMVSFTGSHIVKLPPARKPKTSSNTTAPRSPAIRPAAGAATATTSASRATPVANNHAAQHERRAARYRQRCQQQHQQQQPQHQHQQRPNHTQLGTPVSDHVDASASRSTRFSREASFQYAFFESDGDSDDEVIHWSPDSLNNSSQTGDFCASNSINSLNASLYHPFAMPASAENSSP